MLPGAMRRQQSRRGQFAIEYKTARMGVLMLTLKVDVPQVQYGRQQLQNVLTLVVREEQFQGRTDVLVNFPIVSALALDARPLQQVGVTVVITVALCLGVTLLKVSVVPL